jgi:hypothetical protein
VDVILVVRVVRVLVVVVVVVLGTGESRCCVSGSERLRESTYLSGALLTCSDLSHSK